MPFKNFFYLCYLFNFKAHLFIFCISGGLTSGQTVPCRASWFLRTVNNSSARWKLTCQCALQMRWSSLEPTPSPRPFCSSYTQGHCAPALISPRPGTRNHGQLSCPISCWNRSDEPILNLLTLPLVLFPAGTKILRPTVPLAFSASRRTWDRSGRPCIDPLVWHAHFSPWECNKLPFQWQSSPDLLASPYLKDYIQAVW